MLGGTATPRGRGDASKIPFMTPSITKKAAHTTKMVPIDPSKTINSGVRVRQGGVLDVVRDDDDDEAEADADAEDFCDRNAGLSRRCRRRIEPKSSSLSCRFIRSRSIAVQPGVFEVLMSTTLRDKQNDASTLCATFHHGRVDVRVVRDDNDVTGLACAHWIGYGIYLQQSEPNEPR